MIKPRRRRAAVWILGLLCAVVLGTTAACSKDEGDDAGGQPSIVASTDVWGAVASAVAGDNADVSSLIDSASQDPHSYETNARDILAVSKADLVIENGGGYDDFMDTLLDAGKGDPEILNAVDISGHEATDGAELNEHVWYDLPTVQIVASAIADRLVDIDPAHADSYRANAERFDGELAALIRRESALKGRLGQPPVAITEPVPLAMLQSIGAVNETPPEFSEAVEEGDEVSETVLRATEDLFSEHTVKALVYNEQTTGVVTERVLDAADAAGVPVVPVTETLPDGSDFISWMTDNLDRMAGALE